MVSTILDVAGAALIVAGCAVIFWPSALLVAGVFFLLASYRIEP